MYNILTLQSNRIVGSIYVMRVAKMDFSITASVKKLAKNIQSLCSGVPAYSFTKAFLFSGMPTLKRRVIHYLDKQKNPKQPMLSPEQLLELEEKVNAEFVLTSPETGIKHPFKHYQVEIKGEHTIAYPKYFRAEMDRLIQSYYSKLPEPVTPKKRKRISVTKSPLFSSSKNH